MSLSTTLLIAIGAFLLVLRVITKQIKGSTVTVRGLALVPLILLVVGLLGAKDVITAVSSRDLVLLLLDLVLLAALGAARGASVTVTEKDGGAFQKGTKWTLVLWIATIGARVALIIADHALGMDPALANSTFAATLGVTLGAQNWMIFTRTRRLGIPVAASRSGG
ncbi:hypothetical protein [Actinocrispum wychmicini]|uniref:DUF1453 domain-containing protein n=1 Tax=Actinocrispum wychmicini TaxID=1213861 RepID=A0A4R2J3J0_9PSEU|nr:hypothetical protein [Actinocrispum wychmicini]TCO52564.1 hypothetical protein EV192_112296 [Actinocrispum wychmicini]